MCSLLSVSTHRQAHRPASELQARLARTRGLGARFCRDRGPGRQVLEAPVKWDFPRGLTLRNRIQLCMSSLLRWDAWRSTLLPSVPTSLCLAMLSPRLRPSHAASLQAGPGVRGGKQPLASTGPAVRELLPKRGSGCTIRAPPNRNRDTVIASPEPRSAGLEGQRSDQGRALALLVSHTDHVIFRTAL